MPHDEVDGVVFHGADRPKPPDGISRSEWIRRLHRAGNPWATIRDLTECTRQHYNSALAHRGPWGGGRPPRCQRCGEVVLRYKKGVYFHLNDPDVLAGHCAARVSLDPQPSLGA